ncbi:MAG: acyl-CoA thioesterase domain-containing protein [Pseudomonadota bacterium]
MSSAIQSLSADMIGVLSETAAEIAGNPVSLVSLTLDVVGEISGQPSRYETDLDRNTRTLVFLNARAMDGDSPVLTGTAVFSIKA